ncbi:hypothetical protein M231_06307 [Tremella mesenterica]|uniref:Uncharacterized protein n=1 Tax=Tremella mesenterica TaxID=5217 RepID=A0A4Q1BFA1_TREME|nr:hypothetical protein M231_06307 [Tremella mesenterica]
MSAPPIFLPAPTVRRLETSHESAVSTSSTRSHNEDYSDLFETVQLSMCIYHRAFFGLTSAPTETKVRPVLLVKTDVPRIDSQGSSDIFAPPDEKSISLGLPIADYVSQQREKLRSVIFTSRGKLSSEEWTRRLEGWKSLVQSLEPKMVRQEVRDGLIREADGWEAYETEKQLTAGPSGTSDT